MALAGRIRKQAFRVFVTMSDGECNEGSVWEAAMFAASRKVSNLLAVVDYNKWQATGRSEEVMALAPLRDKWEAFGWNVIEADGHDVANLIGAFEAAERTKGKPSVILAQTVKGKCISFAENNPAFHNGMMTAEQCKTALCDLETIRKGRA